MSGDKPIIEFTENVESQQHKPVDHVLVDADGLVQRLPVPSKDPNDPLNYSWKEKASIIVSCCWFSAMSLSCVGGLGAILGVFFEMYAPQGYSSNQIVWLSTFPSLFVGIGNFLILPLGLLYGRRFAFTVSTIVLLGATIGCALNRSWEQHLALRIIQGLAAGATESVLPLMLAEITFVHQHGMVYGLYWAAQNALTGCLTLAASYEVAALGWRWYYWVFTITIALGLVMVVFGSFETSYKRSSQFINGRMVLTDQFGVTRVLTEHETREYLESRGVHPNEEVPDELREKKTYVQMLKPWSAPTENALAFIPQVFLHIAEAYTSPAILYSTLLSAIVLGSSIGISLTYDTVLETSYHWSASSIGLINLGGVFGGFGGMLYAGFLGDKFIIWMAKRNNGIHTPEHRLILLIFPGILGIVALILYGFTASGGTSWGGPYMGWTLFQVTFVSVLILSTSFAAEAWEKNPGPALVAVVGMKNIVAFGLSYGIIPMVNTYSYKTTMGILAGINAGVFALGVPVYLLNPRWRRYMQNKEAKSAKL